MALRSVVESPASPPASRRTVVLRTGAPAPKGRTLDVVVGLVGVLVLLAAIGLAWYLPDRTYLNPQFRMSFPETVVADLGSGVHTFTEGEGAFDFTYDLPDDNIKIVTLKLGFQDDLPFSMPDRFTVELLAPNGTSVGLVTLENPPPRDAPNATSSPTFEVVDELITFTVAPTPTEQIVTGLTHEETAEQVHARLEPQYRVDNGGAWTVRVTLLFAGDCPTPNQEGSYPSQAFHCTFGEPDNLQTTPNTAPDTGNDFIVQDATYTFYTPEIQELS